jgi:Mg2+ and Co2+ transporter CorA
MDSVMKKFGAMTTIMLPLTFVTGLWGMNVNVRSTILFDATATHMRLGLGPRPG